MTSYRKWRVLGEQIYALVGDTDFTYTQVRELDPAIPLKQSQLFGMYNEKIIVRCDGKFRSTLSGKRLFGPAKWRFTGGFINEIKRRQLRCALRPTE